MSTYVELEIQSLLNHTESLDQVAEQLISGLENSPENFTAENIQALARFLLQSGLYLPLTEFILRHLDDESFPIPWPYFLEALALSSPEIDSRTARSLLEGIEETESQEEASRSQALDQQEPLVGEWRRDRIYKIHKTYRSNKKNLLDQLITLRTQQLYEKEKSLLARLQKLYPNDQDILKEVGDHKQRYALEILARRSPSAHAVPIQDLMAKDEEADQALEVLQEAFFEAAVNNPDMAKDFAVASFMIEGYEAALAIIDLVEQDESMVWLRLEVLLHCRRFIELLNELSHVEVALAHEPETFFATAYLRAQAYWGLGQKHTAIEVMEGLVASRPHYRAASSLLSIWGVQ
ncbi:hypothetical protein D3C87_377670 [compost metagenome]